MKMEITKQGMMTKEEKKAHMHAPCPICGKINLPHRRVDGIFHTKYIYRCTDSSHTTEVTFRDIKRVREKGCECEWNVRIKPKKEFVKSNLKLTPKLVEVMNAIGVVDMDQVRKAHDIQRKYWNKKYNRK